MSEKEIFDEANEHEEEIERLREISATSADGPKEIGRKVVVIGSAAVIALMILFVFMTFLQTNPVQDGIVDATDTAVVETTASSSDDVDRAEVLRRLVEEEAVADTVTGSELEERANTLRELVAEEGVADILSDTEREQRAATLKRLVEEEAGEE